jgi:tetratricopeptide (TPR) repeat protein
MRHQNLDGAGLPDTSPDMAAAKRLLVTDPARAAFLATRVLAAQPRSAAAAFLLGAALRRTGDGAGAKAILAPLTLAQPGFWGAHYELGLAHASAGHSAAAAAALDRAVACNPQSSLALHALGDQLVALGRTAEAAAVQGRAVPGLAHDAMLAKGVAALFDGDAAQAAAILQDRFGLYPGDIAAVRLMADSGLRIGRPAAVAALLAPVVAAAPGFSPARLALALAHYRQDQFEAALALIDPLVVAQPANPAYRALRAATHLQLGDAAAALADQAVVLAHDPGDASAWLAHGHAHKAIGDADAAVAAYRRGIALAPGLGEAWWSLANLKTMRFEPADIAAMQAALPESVSAQDRAGLHFALGKALEDVRDDAAAFRHYAQGNAVRRAEAPYDAAAAYALARRTIASLTPGFLAARRGAGIRDAGPIFIVGMPRSGSTLVEQILASHSDVEGASELPDLPAIASALAIESGDPASWPAGLADVPLARFAALGRDYLARTRIRRRLGRAFLVDKFPGNFVHIGLIHLMLPGAIIVDVRRDAMACCVSLFRQSIAAGQRYAYDLGDLGRAYADYVRVMDHWDQVLPGRVLRLSHEALVADPDAQIARLLAHCGLAPQPGCWRFFETDRVIRTPSAQQVRQPLNRDGLDHWRRFEPWLEPLKAALGPLGGRVAEL